MGVWAWWVWVRMGWGPSRWLVLALRSMGGARMRLKQVARSKTHETSLTIDDNILGVLIKR